MKTIEVTRVGWIPEGESERDTWVQHSCMPFTKGELDKLLDGAFYPTKEDCRLDLEDGSPRKVRITATLTLERELL